ncbi:MAG: BTAD domain-containing putative transcriptional regulator [Pseudolysinimonas sp.]|uniref:BTAD domain-containing putative transcriptional regulator n=1 Tax=Pseudolysinimonas sp. TaxID=2680009 RepID=UPI003C71F283
MQFERWSLPLIGEALLRGATRREEFQSFLGIAPDLLDSRLTALVESGILSVETATDGAEHFVPTEKGRGLEAAIRALDEWSRQWDPLSTDALLGIVDAVVAPQYPDEQPEVPAASVAIELSVLGTFDLRVAGVSADLSPGSQRLLMFLALRDRAIARIALAGTMWPDVSEGRAGDSLRSAIARLEAPARAAIRSASTGLRLADGVVIDLHEAQAMAHRLVYGGGLHDSDISSASIATLSRELLPDWYDDWVLPEAEDWRYLRMNALEALARRLLDAGQLGEAATAARAAMRIDPLREGPQTTLIRVQLAMGNQAAAVEVFNRYRTILHAAVGLAPTKQLADLVADVER